MQALFDHLQEPIKNFCIKCFRRYLWIIFRPSELVIYIMCMQQIDEFTEDHWSIARLSTQHPYFWIYS